MCDSRDAYIQQSKTKVLDFFSKHKFLVSYKKNVRGQKVGVLIAFKDENGNINLGFSKCNHKAGDKFNKYIGLSKAIDNTMQIVSNDCLFYNPVESIENGFRAEWPNRYDVIPFSMIKDVINMVERLKRYFKIGAVSESSVGR